jgi:hypothetical protein
MKLGMYVMALEPISMAYFINPPIVAMQRLGKKKSYRSKCPR